MATFFFICIILLIVGFIITARNSETEESFNKFTYRFKEPSSAVMYSDNKKLLMQTVDFFNELTFENYDSRLINNNLNIQLQCLDQLQNIFLEIHKWDQTRLGGLIPFLNKTIKYVEGDIQFYDSKPQRSAIENKIKVLKANSLDLKSFYESIEKRMTPIEHEGS